jgi:phosphoribosylanthranilate isomerase
LKVKICGITDLETALVAVKCGADAIGFVFADSKRRISIKHARKIIEKLPKNLMKIGVFVNEQGDTIEQIVKETGINMVQLHGDESTIDCAGFSVPVIKALNIESADDLFKANEYDCDYILLDSPKGKYRGGNGIVFDWNIIKQIKGKVIILAGGLTRENVAEAIQTVHPYMVDVSSGVELNGKKDKGKINDFINEAKGRKKNDNLHIAR